jgi:CDGSH-type Zn-finger protein
MTASVEFCPGGPLLVRGATEVTDDNGEVHPVERPVVALCRCRRSQRKPWCDNSHKQPKRKEDRR